MVVRVGGSKNESFINDKFLILYSDRVIIIFPFLTKFSTSKSVCGCTINLCKIFHALLILKMAYVLYFQKYNIIPMPLQEDGKADPEDSPVSKLLFGFKLFAMVVV